jgi:hypothetical protein
MAAIFAVSRKQFALDWLPELLLLDLSHPAAAMSAAQEPVLS